MGLYGLDTNVFITAWWRTYPNDVFPTLWDHLSSRVDNIPILQPVLTELRRKDDAVRSWVESQQFSIAPITPEMNQEAIRMEARYHTGISQSGANSFDIQLISWAKVTGNTIVTFESQPNPPGKIHNYKIPLICKIEGVRCILFVDFLRELSISI